jgi:hypothetical protein
MPTPTLRAARRHHRLPMLCMAGLIAAALSACGGGGGPGPGPSANPTQADPLNQVDGLGDRGELPGTVVVGDVVQLTLTADAPNVGQASALHLNDDGSAFMVWKAASTSATSATTTNELRWSRVASGNAPWQAARTLSGARMGVYDVQLLLRGNAQGALLLGWRDTGGDPLLSEGRLLRWHSGTEWEATPPDTSPYLLNWPHIDGWGLALLNDGTALSDTRDPLAGSGTLWLGATDTTASRVIRDSAMQAKAFAPFGPDSAQGLTVAVIDSPVQAGTHRVVVRVENPITGLSAPSTVLPDLSEVTVCTDVQGFNGVQVVGSNARQAAIAVWVASFSGGCEAPDMRLVHASVEADDATYSFQTRYVSSLDTEPFRSPRLAIDGLGRALVVWCRGLLPDVNYSGVSPAGCFWAGSDPSGAWTEPAALVSNIASLGTYARGLMPSLAMNAQGEAVAALLIDGLAPPGVVNDLLVVGRFSFASGWQAWTKAANKMSLRGYAITINASGQAMLSYSALDAQRTGGRAPNSYGYSGGPQNAPWMRAFVSKL